MNIKFKYKPCQKVWFVDSLSARVSKVSVVTQSQNGYAIKFNNSSRRFTSESSLYAIDEPEEAAKAVQRCIAKKQKSLAHFKRINNIS